ncbi:pyridoxal phosphate-dependent aminotransferase [Fibrivirga algicola]|uniref:Aminotransferase class I/II-fold pyridoxal phosphate-dependent enzyme n=1 Tax=Fibrivirga algicola TaxID=2950420 RepID=A0ABX0QL90_9BACT|nr:aminotransferase class I/II-fold pyridoxal phosphate-dependent enzyme [Fibrivirga algicola]NID13054.1 aminotransferase class I/II-fold pyridoxal phosphate-dependent enzyme [Fibrivirga algicola]
MSHIINRRNWLRLAGLLSAGLGLSRWQEAKAAFIPDSVAAEQRLFQEFAQLNNLPPDTIPALKARLFANENPYGIAASAKEALNKASVLGNRYAWMEFAQLKTLIGKEEGVAAKNILITPGSSDVLMAGAAYYSQKGPILTCRPTYDDLLERATGMKGQVLTVPATAGLGYDLAALKAKALSTPGLSMVYIVNPNNPTGTLVPAAELTQFCRDVAPTVPVFIDEAYIDFLEPAERPMLGKLITEGLDVILARTFSKIHGFAGLRLGYVMAQPKTLQQIKPFTNGEFAVSITTLMAGIASYQDQAWQTYCRTENAKARDYTMKALKGLGYEPIPSAANFILFPIKMKTKAFEGQMYGHGVGIQTREIDKQPYCRVSIGTQAEMETFVDAFKKVVG